MAKSTTRFRRRTSHSKIETNDEPSCKCAVARIIFDFSKPGEEAMEIKIPGVQLLKERKDWGHPMSLATERPHFIVIIMNDIRNVSPQQATQSGIMTIFLFGQEWKMDTEVYERLGRPDEIPGERHENPNLFSLSRGNLGTAQSCVNEVRPRDRLGTRYRFSRRDMASTVWHGKRWRRIEIVCRSKIIGESGAWSCANGKKMNFKCYRRWRETFYDLVIVHDCNNGISSNHGNELPEQLPIHCKHNRSRTQTNVRPFYKIDWCLIKMGSEDWRQLVARIICGKMSMIGDEKVFNLQRTKVYVFPDSLVCLGQIHENYNRTMHGNKDWDG